MRRHENQIKTLVVLSKVAILSLFWKFVNEEHDEVEIALRVETDTWCAIGWRPSDLDGSCKVVWRSFPS